MFSLWIITFLLRIKGYYYDDGKWHDASASGAKVQWTVDNVELKLADDGYYHYTFKNLPTELQDSNGNTYLMGYKVTLDEKSIDKTNENRKTFL